MSTTTHNGEDVVEEVNNRLCDEFGDQLPPRRITGIVRAAQSDLEGRIIPGSLGELLHRLARFRVAQTLDIPSNTFD